MIDNTINDDRTVAGGGEDMILAGRYHILRQLGQGGMGAVWLAEDRQLDNRKVAIKMLPSIIVTDKRAYNQLKSEALVSLKLIHPNIVTLRAFEENDGAPFLVMDYIDGRSLSDYLAVKGKLSEAETIELLEPIADALDYAHGEKVIHRDVKPSNIIIRKDGHPFILDFGIAREIQESMTRVTGGTVSGTLLYMSPEQLRGAPPAPAQDVYSFAAMVYECLNGEPPFIRGEIAYQIINENPMPLTGTPQLVVSVMAGLAKKPEKRPNKCVAILCERHISQDNTCAKIHSRISFVKNGDAKKQKSNGARTVLWAVGAVLVVGLIAFLYQGVSTYSKNKNTNQFLALFDTQMYSAAAQLINKIDVSDVRVQFSLGEMYSNGNGVTKDKATAFRWYREAAERGNVAAQFNLGNMYYDGQGVAEDDTEAVKWYYKAAEQGMAIAQFYLGMMYHNGRGVVKNEVEAVRWYRKAAEQGLADAQSHLSVMYRDGKGVGKDVEEAARWCGKAAAQGDVNAQNELAEMYENGNGVVKDETEALKWYRRAADQGSYDAKKAIERLNADREARIKARATWLFLESCKEEKYDVAASLIKKVDCNNVDVQFNLGIMYANGNGVVTNQVESARWYRKAAEQGHVDAQALLAEMYDDGIGVEKDATVAAKWYREAAEQGHAGAQNNLACKYADGSGVTKDYNEALKWYHKAAEQGFVIAQNNLGKVYQEGKLAKKNSIESMKWYRAAAEQGKPNAQYNLGRMYVNGSGGKKDDTEAVKWYQKAVEQGDADALYNLGLMYACGYGVTKDEMKAMKCWEKATEQGHVTASRFMEGLKICGNKGHKSGDTQIIELPGGATMEMIYCAPGTFMMGTPESEFRTNADYEKLHFVMLTKGFWLGKYEVTQKQWRSVMWYNHSHFKGDNLPVESVSWKECQEFITKVNAQLNCGARLPTEAEWEYACRAGTTGAYGGTGNINDMGWYKHFGDISDTSRTYSADKDGHTYSVGKKKANDWGFYDMHGNVSEWCSDWIGDYYGDEIDPTGVSHGRSRMHRGGSYFDWNVYCRSASRPIETGFPDSGSCTTGFRLACSEIPRQQKAKNRHRLEAMKSLEVLDENTRQTKVGEASKEIVAARSAMDLKNWETAYKKYSQAFKHLEGCADAFKLRKECAEGMAEARYQAGREALRCSNSKKTREYMYEARKLGHPHAQVYIDYIDGKKTSRRERGQP